ncbi:MAG: hypothetical protein MJ145_04290, partial [Clostridia bacterium]|nr:hypothetical protein [Clostridia bacterium]
DGNIVMDSEEESIGMGLPEEVQDEEGILTNDGTVIYGATQDVSVAVQVGEEELGGTTCEFTRALVTIDNADAPKEYSFKFDLPEGYKLITDKEY